MYSVWLLALGFLFAKECVTNSRYPFKGAVLHGGAHMKSLIWTPFAGFGRD